MSIILKNINKFYGKTQVLSNIDLEIKKDEFLILIGPSGSGKSTLLKLISGLEKVSSGEIISKTPLNNIALVTQNYTLYPHMNVFDNLAFTLKMDKLPKGEILKKVETIAKKLHINNLLDRKPHQLSGGQRQRVALGKALIKNPALFIFDEPLSSLDLKLKIEMKLQIMELHKQLIAEGKNATTIYVTHDQFEAMSMGDRICILNNGKIIQLDTPEKIYSCPINKFVAEFIGYPTMNFITGKLKREENQIRFYPNDDFFLVLSSDYEKKLENYINKHLILGIRHHNILLSDYCKGNSILSEISLIENNGENFYIHFDFCGTKFVANSNFNPNNNRYYFHFDMEKIYLFDIDTEETITL